jgi:hypothetical protein
MVARSEVSEGCSILIVILTSAIEGSRLVIILTSVHICFYRLLIHWEQFLSKDCEFGYVLMCLCASFVKNIFDCWCLIFTQCLINIA